MVLCVWVSSMADYARDLYSSPMTCTVSTGSRTLQRFTGWVSKDLQACQWSDAADNAFVTNVNRLQGGTASAAWRSERMAVFSPSSLLLPECIIHSVMLSWAKYVLPLLLSSRQFAG